MHFNKGVLKVKAEGNLEQRKKEPKGQEDDFRSAKSGSFLDVCLQISLHVLYFLPGLPCPATRISVAVYSHTTLNAADLVRISVAISR